MRFFCDYLDTTIGLFMNGKTKGSNLKELPEDKKAILMEDSEKAIKLYPNPTNGLLQIESNTLAVNLEVIDITGRIILKPLVIDNQADLGSINAGIYYIRILNANGNVIHGQVIHKTE